MYIVASDLSKYDMFLYNTSYQSRIKAPMRIKFMTSNTEKPAIHDVGDVADCLVVSLWSLSVEKYCYIIINNKDVLRTYICRRKKIYFNCNDKKKMIYLAHTVFQFYNQTNNFR